VKKIIALLLSLVMMFTFGTSAFASDGEILSAKKEIPEEVVEETSLAFFGEKTDIILSGNSLKSVDSFEKGSEKYLIASYRERLADKGESYSSSRTAVDILDQKKEPFGNVCVTVKETTFLTIAENGIETGYSAKHDLIYSFENGSWVLIEDRQLEPTGLLPLWQAEEFVYNKNRVSG